MKKNNIIFSIIIFFLILLIPIMNFFVDPYNIKYLKNNIIDWQMFPTNVLYTALKINKNVKYNYVMVGGSSVQMFTPRILASPHEPVRDKKIAILRIEALSFTQMRNLTLDFLELHPETKNVILAIDFSCLCKNERIFNTEYNNGKFNFKEFCLLYFSKKVTKESIDKIIGNINYKLKLKKTPPDFSFKYFPKRNYYEPSQEHYEKNINNLYSLIDELQKRNINIICYTFPYNSLFLQSFPNQQVIEDLKRNIVNKIGFMYDMAFVNEYTKIKLDTDNYLYSDVIHPAEYFASIFYDYVFYNNKREDLIIKLTLQNIDKIIELERNLLSDYKKENQEHIQIYDSYRPDKYTKKHLYLKDFNLEKKNKYENIPDELKQQIKKLYVHHPQDLFNTYGFSYD